MALATIFPSSSVSCVVLGRAAECYSLFCLLLMLGVCGFDGGPLDPVLDRTLDPYVLGEGGTENSRIDPWRWRGVMGAKTLMRLDRFRPGRFGLVGFGDEGSNLVMVKDGDLARFAFFGDARGWGGNQPGRGGLAVALCRSFEAAWQVGGGGGLDSRVSSSIGAIWAVLGQNYNPNIWLDVELVALMLLAALVLRGCWSRVFWARRGESSCELVAAKASKKTEIAGLEVSEHEEGMEGTDESPSIPAIV